ncbi:MAG: hypothetical protein M5U28_50840 [Sandaracinaceae bacterium]|nr:hypothetical protein [Sandaracinaceae bacterium]
MARGPDSGWIAAGLVIFSLGYVVSSGVAAAGLLAMQGPYPDPSVHCRNEMGGLSLIPLVGQLAGALHLDQCLPRGWGRRRDLHHHRDPRDGGAGAGSRLRHRRDRRERGDRRAARGRLAIRPCGAGRRQSGLRCRRPSEHEDVREAEP